MALTKRSDDPTKVVKEVIESSKVDPPEVDPPEVDPPDVGDDDDLLG